MKILLNFEPVGIPDMFLNSLSLYKNFCENTYSYILENNDCKSLISERVKYQAKAENYELKNYICIDDREYCEAFENDKFSLLKMTELFYTGNIDHHILTNLDKLYKHHFNNWEPDIILSFEFHNKIFDSLFPNSLQIVYSGGIFKKGILPPTITLDVIGSGVNPFYNHYMDVISNLKISPRDNQILENLKQNITDLLTINNPIKDIIKDYKNKFDYLLLFPCQFNAHYSVDTETEFKSQVEIVSYILSKIPSNVGLIVTEHQHYPFINEGVYEKGGFYKWLKNKYENFIYIEDLKNYPTSSLWLIPYIDGVVNVSSSVGLLSILFDKKVFDLGKHFNLLFRDTIGIDNVIKTLKVKNKNRNPFLWWLLTRYNFYHFQYQDKAWLNNFLNKALCKYKQNGINEQFYEENITMDEVSEYILNFLKSELELLNNSTNIEQAEVKPNNNTHMVFNILGIKIKFRRRI